MSMLRSSNYNNQIKGSKSLIAYMNVEHSVNDEGTKVIVRSVRGPYYKIDHWVEMILYCNQGLWL